MERYVRGLQKDPGNLLDLLIVAIDANCNSYAKRKKTINEKLPAEVQTITVCAIPDPHVERWLLIDQSAFKAVFGKGCAAPPAKCERNLYKRLLIEAIRETGLTPLVGGIEHARDIIDKMDFDNVDDNSFEKLLKDLQSKFWEWIRNGQDCRA